MGLGARGPLSLVHWRFTLLMRKEAQDPTPRTRADECARSLTRIRDGLIFVSREFPDVVSSQLTSSGFLSRRRVRSGSLGMTGLKMIARD